MTIALRLVYGGAASVLLLIGRGVLLSSNPVGPISWDEALVLCALGVVLVYWAFIRFPKSRLPAMATGTAGKHYRRLCWAWWAFLAALVLVYMPLGVGRVGLDHGQGAAELGMALGLFFAMAVVLVATGLWIRAVWSRRLAEVLAFLVAFDWPFGVVLGVYTWWVLAPRPGGLHRRRFR